jgi:Caspase domain
LSACRLCDKPKREFPARISGQVLGAMRLSFGFDGRKLLLAAAVAAMAAFLGFTGPARAQDKVALIIGNGAYQNVPELPNPPHDAADVAAAFRQLGFSVQLLTNASYEDMRRALLKFSGKARNAKMAVIFFAGHGMEMDGENWLIPTDAELKTDLDVDQEAISLHAVMLMASAASKLGLIILDACRNNPFLRTMKRTIATRSLSRGLSRIEPENNVLVAYSAKDGTTAADGSGRNSPFTTALLKYLEVPGLEINFLFRDVRDDVIASTGGEQEPFVYGSLSKEAIYFKPPPAATPTSGAAAAAWSLLNETTDGSALKRFVAQYPDSPLRKDAEARIAALDAARAAQPKPPSPDEIAWNMVKDSTDPDELRRFIKEFPGSAKRTQAQQKVAVLTSAAANAASVNTVDPHALALSLQFELRRVGCFNGALNGEFDDATRAAERNFARLASVKMPDKLSPAAVKAVRGFDKKVCPLACRDGQRAEGDRCVAIAPPRRAESRKSAVKRNATRRSATNAAAPRGNGKCFSFGGRNFCE